MPYPLPVATLGINKTIATLPVISKVLLEVGVKLAPRTT